MNKLLTNFMGEAEKWIAKNKYKIFLSFIVSMIFVIAGYLPYLNLIFSQNLIIVIICFIIVTIFDNRFKSIVFLAIVLFVISMLMFLIGRQEVAEQLGVIIYMILFARVVKEMIVSL